MLVVYYVMMVFINSFAEITSYIQKAKHKTKLYTYIEENLYNIFQAYIMNYQPVAKLAYSNNTITTRLVKQQGCISCK